MKTYITICKNVILSNIKNGTNNPAVRVSKGKYGKPKHYHRYKQGNITVDANMIKPLPWGARVWVEIEDEVVNHASKDSN